MAAKKKTTKKAARKPVAKKATRKKAPVKKKAPVRKTDVKKKAVRKKPTGKKGMETFVPTPEQQKQVELMIGIGLKIEEIAMLTINPRTGKGIAVNTLQKHFAEELGLGRAKMKGKLYQSMWRKALGDHPSSATMAIWITKCQFGWREEQKITHDIEKGSTGVLVAPAAISPEDWLAKQNQDDDPDKEAK